MTESITNVSDAVAELGALPVPQGSQPLTLTEAQVEALAAAGNRVVNDAVHEDLCMCDAWPEKCLSSGNLRMGDWDMSGLKTALPAVLALWEQMRGGEMNRLRARVAELEAERHVTNEALDNAVQELRTRETQLAVASGQVPFEYVDAHNHRVLLNKTTDGLDQPYVWFQTEDLDIGGAMVNVWLPIAEVGRLGAALRDGVGFEFTDHSGDSIAVASAAEDWTVFTFTRCPDDEDDEEPATVRVVVLTARVPQLRAALNLLRAETGGA